MRYLDAGGDRLSVIGLGTWQFGSREWGYGEAYAEGEAGRIVQRALDLGINVIDTAEIYGFGRSERIVGRAIAGQRDRVFVATKLFPLLPVDPVIGQRGRASARRLGVETIDLYQIHQPNPVVPWRLQMAGMSVLADAGVIRHVGVSNFTLPQWRAAEAARERPVLSNQVRFSLVDRRPLPEMIPWAASHGRVVIAYSPLGQGLLSARYDANNVPRNGVRALNPLFLPENLQRATPLIRALRSVASTHGATPAQVALAWVVRRPNVVAIPGASTVDQLEHNAAAADLELSDQEDAELTAAAEAFGPVVGPGAWVGLARRRLGSAVSDRSRRK